LFIRHCWKDSFQLPLDRTRLNKGRRRADGRLLMTHIVDLHNRKLRCPAGVRRPTLGRWTSKSSWSTWFENARGTKHIRELVWSV